MKIVVKGVMTVEDALASVKHGVDGIWVSNHGARQLDTTPATIEVSIFHISLIRLISSFDCIVTSLFHAVSFFIRLHIYYMMPLLLCPQPFSRPATYSDTAT